MAKGFGRSPEMKKYRVADTALRPELVSHLQSQGYEVVEPTLEEKTLCKTIDDKVILMEKGDHRVLVVRVRAKPAFYLTGEQGMNEPDYEKIKALYLKKGIDVYLSFADEIKATLRAGFLSEIMVHQEWKSPVNGKTQLYPRLSTAKGRDDRYIINFALDKRLPVIAKMDPMLARRIQNFSSRSDEYAIAYLSMLDLPAHEEEGEEAEENSAQPSMESLLFS